MIMEKFNTYLFADCKEKVIDMLAGDNGCIEATHAQLQGARGQGREQGNWEVRGRRVVSSASLLCTTGLKAGVTP